MGVPVLLWIRNGAVYVSAGGKRRRLKWKPGQSKAKLNAEVMSFTAEAMPDWAKDLLLVVVKAAVAAFLKWLGGKVEAKKKPRRRKAKK